MSDWTRVSRKDRCPVCGNSSWCTYTDSVVLCMRVESNRSKLLKSGETGWIHRVGEETPARPSTVEREDKVPSTINSSALIRDWSSATPRGLMAQLAVKLGVNMEAMDMLNCCWAKPHRAWAFPMSDGYGNYVGIRLRAESGAKWAVRGSHQGIFLPRAGAQENMLIVEGPTDAAAGLSIGFFTVGRPSCSGGAQHLIAAIRRLGVREAVIVSDNDDPGTKGASMLAQLLPVRSCLVLLPTKDLRQFVNAGGNKVTLNALIKGCLWNQPRATA
jgi:hypothetical protein